MRVRLRGARVRVRVDFGFGGGMPLGRKMGMPYFDLPLTWWGSNSGSAW